MDPPVIHQPQWGSQPASNQVSPQNNSLTYLNQNNGISTDVQTYSGNESGKEVIQQAFYGSPQNYIMGDDSKNEITMTNGGISSATPLDLLKQKFGSPHQSLDKINIEQDSSLRNMLQRNSQFTKYSSFNSTNSDAIFLNPHWKIKDIKKEEVPLNNTVNENFFNNKTDNKDHKNIVSHRETFKEELDNNNTFASNAPVVTNYNQMLISDNLNSNSYYEHENVHKSIYHTSGNSSSQMISNDESNNSIEMTNYVQSQASIQNGDNSLAPMSLIISNTNGILSYQTGVVANQEIIQNLSGPVQNNSELGSGSHPAKDIPDLRQQFMQMQNIPFPGQMVILPPLSEDRSIQILQLLTPLDTGGYNTQTIVLPIMKVGQPNHEIQGNLNPVLYNQPQIQQLCTQNQTHLESNHVSHSILQPNTSYVPSFPGGQYPTQMLINQSEPSAHNLTSVPIQSPDSLPDASNDDSSRLHQSDINSSNQEERQSQEQFVTNKIINQASETNHQYSNNVMANSNQNNSSHLPPQIQNLTQQQNLHLNSQPYQQPIPTAILVQQPYHLEQAQAQGAIQPQPVILQPPQGILTPIGTPEAYASGTDIYSLPIEGMVVPSGISPSPSVLPLMAPETGCLNIPYGAAVASAVGTAIMSLPVLNYSQQLAPQTLDPLVVSSEDDELLLNQLDETGLPKVMQGIDLDRMKQFASDFKEARQKLGLTQTQVGQHLQSMYGEGIMVSQSTICRFEKLEITAQQVKKLLPILQAWLDRVRKALNQGPPVDMDAIMKMPKDCPEIKPRKRRTIFGENVVATLNSEFKMNSSPGHEKLAEISNEVGLDKETVRIWFGNRRQTEKKARKE